MKRPGGTRPKWVKRFGGPGGATPGDSSSVTQYLEPGSYTWICPVEDRDGSAVDTPLRAARHTIRVENAGVEPHDLVRLKLAPGKTGMESYFEADLGPGEYVLVCMARAPDGRSHIEHGMVRQVSIH